MPRNTGIGMPKKRKRATSEQLEELEAPLEQEEPVGILGSTSSTSNSPPSASAVRKAVLEKLEDAYEAAALEVEVAEETMTEEKNKWELAQRLHRAKMNRFSKSVDNAKGSPTLQLERYYQAELELAKAATRHEAAMRLTAQAQANAWEALVDVQAAEIKALRRLGPAAGP